MANHELEIWKNDRIIPITCLWMFYLCCLWYKTTIKDKINHQLSSSSIYTCKWHHGKLSMDTFDSFSLPIDMTPVDIKVPTAPKRTIVMKLRKNCFFFTWNLVEEWASNKSCHENWASNGTNTSVDDEWRNKLISEKIVGEIRSIQLTQH